MGDVGPQLEPLSLGSVSDGAAEKLFAIELEDVRAIFEKARKAIESGRSVEWADSNGVVTAKIGIDVAIFFDVETGQVQTGVTSKLTRPKRKEIRRPAFLGEDGMSAVHEARQMDFTRPKAEE